MVATKFPAHTPSHPDSFVPFAMYYVPVCDEVNIINWMVILICVVYHINVI